ncbi:MAG: prolyl oligopeptidase family serine peptidase [Thermomicrobiales bacterium]
MTIGIDQLLAIRSIGGTEQPHWSPDGTEIRFVSSLGDGPEIWSIRADGSGLRQLTVGMGGVGHLATFMPKHSPIEDRIAYVSDKTGSDEIWLWTGDGKADRQITRFGARIEAYDWSADGSKLAVAASTRGTFDIYLVALDSLDATRLTSHDNYEVYPQFTPDGGRILFVRLNQAWTEHTVVSIAVDGSDECVLEVDTNFFDYHYGREFGYPLVSPDGASYLFRSHRNGWENIWMADVDGSGAPRPLAEAHADQYDAAWSPDGSTVAYIENHDGTLALRIASADGSGELDGFSPRLGCYSKPAWSPNGRQIAYLSGTPTSPNSLWVVDVETGEKRQLTHSVPAGVEQHLVTPEKIRYESWDGREISAYVLRPPDPKPDEKYPGLMWIHGGPTSQYLDAFDPLPQFFALNGYVVMMPNVRGSSGYGREFEDLNDRDWGHGDLRDAIAGANWMKGNIPEIDPDNTGITGTSYGGIMSMAATVWCAPGVFQAAAPMSGYCDFIYMTGEEEIRHNKMMEYEFGKLPEAIDVYRHCSPIYWTQQANVPCFIIQGEGSYPGSTSSKDFALALEAAYKPYWYKAYQGETYYVAGRENVRQMLQDMKIFFDFFLKGIPHPPLSERDIQTRLSGILPYRSWLSTEPFYPRTDGPRYG